MLNYPTTHVDHDASEVSVTPTIDTNAYSAGDLVGGKMTFSDLLPTDGQAFIKGVRVEDAADQAAELVLIFFGSDPTNTTFSDNDELDVDDDDLGKIIGTVRIRAGQGPGSESYERFKDNAVALVSDFSLPVGAAGTDLYAAIKVEDTPTYAATNDLTVTVIAWH